MHAEGSHAFLAQQPLRLADCLLRVGDERIRPASRHERAVRLVAPVRETLGDKLAAAGATPPAANRVTPSVPGRTAPSRRRSAGRMRRRGRRGYRQPHVA